MAKLTIGKVLTTKKYDGRDIPDEVHILLAKALVELAQKLDRNGSISPEDFEDFMRAIGLTIPSTQTGPKRQDLTGVTNPDDIPEDLANIFLDLSNQFETILRLVDSKGDKAETQALISKLERKESLTKADLSTMARIIESSQKSAQREIDLLRTGLKKYATTTDISNLSQRMDKLATKGQVNAIESRFVSLPKMADLEGVARIAGQELGKAQRDIEQKLSVLQTNISTLPTAAELKRIDNESTSKLDTLKHELEQKVANVKNSVASIIETTESSIIQLLNSEISKAVASVMEEVRKIEERLSKDIARRALINDFYRLESYVCCENLNLEHFEKHYAMSITIDSMVNAMRTQASLSDTAHSTTDYSDNLEVDLSTP